MKKLPCLFFLIFTLQLAAQHPLRVGVVLSGGGAKGVAHVGALRVIEQAGIRIDYIGGASMGGIVGGLYASGWSVDQLDSIMRNNDLAAVLQDEVKRKYQPFFNKQYGEKYIFRLSFKDFKLSLPSALSEGQQAFDFMSELTDHVYNINDFSQLPVPFLCIGTDVSTGEQVILERGNLAQAMRASGSFPGLLAPVEMRDGRLSTDGGVVNDFPAKEVRDKGMDIVIGVNVESKPYKKDELKSVEKIFEQISSYQMIARSREQLQYCDLVIRPDIEGFGVTSFESVDTLIHRGELAARQLWEQLRWIAQQQQAKPEPERIAIDPLANAGKPLQISAVELEANPMMRYRPLLRKFPVPLPGEISFDKFREGIAALYATDNFRYIDYNFICEPDSSRKVFFKLHPKPGYESSLRMGLHFDQVYKSSLLLNGTFRNLIFQSSILSADFIIGDKLRYNLNYYVDNGKYLGVGFNSRLNLVDLYIDLPVRLEFGDISVQNLLFKLTDFTQEAYLNIVSGNQFALGLAAEIKFFKTATDQAVNYLTEENYINEKGWYGSAKSFFRYDSRDRKTFTRKGVLASLDIRATNPLTSLKYEDLTNALGWNIDLRLECAQPITTRLTAVWTADVGVTRGVPAPPYRYFLGSNNRNLINNFRPFLGLPFAKVSGNNLLKTGLALRYQLLKNHYLNISGHLASLSDSAVPFSSSQDLYRSMGFSYGIDTFLGPVEVTYGLSNRGGEIYFNVGYWF